MEQKMVQNTKLTKMIFWAMMVAVGVVISPLLRIEGMCPMAHFINVTCAVLLGPWYAFLCALAIGLIRMAFMGIPPLALTGAVFGAALSGILYRASKGKIIFAFLGEVIGTGIIISGNGAVMGQNRAYMAVLCAVLYSGNINRRQYRLFILKAVTAHETADKVPAGIGNTGL